MAVTICILWVWLVANSQIRQSSAEAGFSDLEIRVARPRVFESHPMFKGFANTPIDFLLSARVMYAHACDPRLSAGARDALFVWTIRPKEDRTELSETTINSTSCHLRWQAPFEGDFHISLAVLSNSSGEVLASGSREVWIKDIWIVAMGDSFAAGQGNPDESCRFMCSIPAQWVDKECFRSAYGSWQFRTYKYVEQFYRNHGVLFTYLPCSGATMKSILSPGGQLDQVAEIQAAANKKLCACKGCCPKPIKPDVVLMAAGGNDIDFTEIIETILSTNDFVLRRLIADVPRRLRELGETLQDFGNDLKRKLPGVDPSTVFYTHYFSISKDEEQLPNLSCMDKNVLRRFTQASNRILDNLNLRISAACKQHNWTPVEGIAEAFEGHGYCSQYSYIRNVNQSFTSQGNRYGAFHPNRAGHSRVAQMVWAAVRQKLAHKL